MTFQWPAFYHFAPFFTIQPNLQIRKTQLQEWANLVIDYCQFHKLHAITLDEIAKSELFNNRNLNRRLDDNGIKMVFDYLEEKKHIEWRDKEKRRCNIYWRRPEEWAQLIHKWAGSFGMLNTALTFFDITQTDDTINEPFHGLDQDVLLKAMEYLEAEKKAALIEVNGEISGVKFL